jgi:hypothetical protein
MYRCYLGTSLEMGDVLLISIYVNGLKMQEKNQGIKYDIQK